MGKKSKAEASGPVANGSASQAGADLVIQPQKSTPKLDTSKWPLLLKVRMGGATVDYLFGMHITACERHTEELPCFKCRMSGDSLRRPCGRLPGTLAGSLPLPCSPMRNPGMHEFRSAVDSPVFDAFGLIARSAPAYSKLMHGGGCPDACHASLGASDCC